MAFIHRVPNWATEIGLIEVRLSEEEKQQRDLENLLIGVMVGGVPTSQLPEGFRGYFEQSKYPNRYGKYRVFVLDIINEDLDDCVYDFITTNLKGRLMMTPEPEDRLFIGHCSGGTWHGDGVNTTLIQGNSLKFFYPLRDPPYDFPNHYNEACQLVLKLVAQAYLEYVGRSNNEQKNPP